MSKTINPAVQALIDSKNYAGVVLAKLEFEPTYRICNAYQSIYWDEGLPSPDAGEQEYLGGGDLVGVSVLSESSELSATSIQLSLSGIPNSSITKVFSNDYIGNPVYLYYAALNPDTYAVEGGPSGPVLIFAGRMDFCNIEFGDTATIVVNATSRLADWERGRGGRFNESYQRTHVDPGDKGFRWVNALQNKTISWGGVTVTDPGGQLGRGGSRGGPGKYGNSVDLGG